MNSTFYAVDEYGNKVEDVRSGYVGEIKMFGFSGVPAHCLACDGSLLSIAAYPELYAKLGTLYGGDGVTTFALPTAEDVIYAAGNGRAVGAAVADGLPNITGTCILYQKNITGAFQSGAVESKVRADESPNAGYTFAHADFNASRSSSIYGASEHVQPKGTAFNFCIVYE